MPALVDALADIIWPFVDTDFAFFGHSMGALVAFEIARELRRRGGIKAQMLFVSGRRAPHLRNSDALTYNLPEAELIAELRRLNGTPRELLEDRGVMRMLLPLLRADFELLETYQYRREMPLDIPIVVYGGVEDAEAPRNELLQWEDQTTAAFSLHMLPGDHFFVRSSQSILQTLLSHELRLLAR